MTTSPTRAQSRDDRRTAVPRAASIALAALLGACRPAATAPPPAAPPPADVVAEAPVPKAIQATPLPRTEAELQVAIADDIHDAAAWEELARLYFERSRERPAARAIAIRVAEDGLAALARQRRDSADLRTTRALLALDTGDTAAAMQDLEVAVRLDPGAARALRPLALLALQLRDYPRASAALHALAVLPTGKGDPDVWIALGVAERGLGRLDDAEQAYAHALKLAPTDPRPYFNLGVLYRHRAIFTDLDNSQQARTWKVARAHLLKFLAATRDDAALRPQRAIAQDIITQADELDAAIHEIERIVHRPHAFREMMEQLRHEEELERQHLLELEREVLAAEAAEQAEQRARLLELERQLLAAEAAELEQLQRPAAPR